jgi:hypothetical protein
MIRIPVRHTTHLPVGNMEMRGKPVANKKYTKIIHLSEFESALLSFNQPKNLNALKFYTP